jgi:hypothetical protein
LFLLEDNHWLVVWNTIFPYIGNNHPNYFSEGLKPPTRSNLLFPAQFRGCSMKQRTGNRYMKKKSGQPLAFPETDGLDHSTSALGQRISTLESPAFMCATQCHGHPNAINQPFGDGKQNYHLCFYGDDLGIVDIG